MPLESDHRTPGQLIEELLATRGWTQRVLAIVLGSSETGINKLIAGKQSVDAKMAIALSELFGVEAQRFLELQNSYDLAREKIVTKADPGRTTRAYLFGDLPITDMIKRGWLDAEDVRDIPKVQSALTKFFKAQSLEEIEILPHAAKKTQINSKPNALQMAWIYRVKQLADEMMVSKYSQEGVKEAIKRISLLRQNAEDVRKVPRILQDFGIRFVIVEALSSSGIDGVCYWLDESSPVVGMSLRHDRIDNFWFVLRHELEHVLLRHGLSMIMLDYDLEGERAGTGADVPEEERQANAAAAAFCVPPPLMNKFYSSKNPFFSERDVLAFAKMLKVHPGLVAGQLRYKTGRYNIFSAHLVKVRQMISETALVDGWGEIAPTED